MQRIVFACILFFTGTWSLSLAAAPVTTGSLVNEMTDLRRLTEFPEPFYKTVQFSSYDHQSRLPGGPGWFRNSDGFGGESIPYFEGVVMHPPEGGGRGTYLVCDVQGPGAIVRTWSARIAGEVRVYLDDHENAVFDGPAEQFFMRLYAPYCGEAGIGEEVLAGTFFQRDAAYCPVPFAKRCRVLWIGDVRQTHFYQLQVRCYEAGTAVETFTPGDLKANADAILRVARILADPDRAWPYASKEQAQSFEVPVEAGTSQPAIELSGPQAIERLSLRVEAADRDLALRQTIMRVICDDYPWGQVQSPVGDFFGAAPGVNPYTSVPFSVSADGTMTSRYVMAFSEKCRILFENLGEQPVRVHGEVLPMAYTWDPDRSMHFRARWRIDHGVLGSGAAPQDMPYLIANGAGVYVGSVTYVLNPNEVPSSGGNWWGEGDEKIFVDEDERPSTFGTGSEDYYNYSWSSSDIFFYPYCGQPVNDGPANRGFVTNNRWHILDPLPFRERLSFYMELFPHERNFDMAYGRIGYHYARPGLMDDHVLITREDVRRQVLPRTWMPAARGAAEGAMFYQTEDVVTGGASGAVMVKNPLWAGGALYRWQPKSVGAELVLQFPIEKARKYSVMLVCALDKDAGKISMTVDGQDVGFGGRAGMVDLYAPSRTLSRCFGGRAVELGAGSHTVAVQYEGGPGGAAQGSIGIDFVWVQRR